MSRCGQEGAGRRRRRARDHVRARRRVGRRLARRRPRTIRSRATAWRAPRSRRGWATGTGSSTRRRSRSGRRSLCPPSPTPEADYLVSGWSPRYVDGSAMAASGALIAFNLEERPTGAVTLELLIRSKAPKNTMLKCAVALNGHELGTISLDRPIANFSHSRLPPGNGGQRRPVADLPARTRDGRGRRAHPAALGLALMTYPTATGLDDLRQGPADRRTDAARRGRSLSDPVPVPWRRRRPCDARPRMGGSGAVARLERRAGRRPSWRPESRARDAPRS